MRFIFRRLSYALIVAGIVYGVLVGGIAWPRMPAVANDSACAHIDWYNAPAGFGQREWVASYHGPQSGTQWEQWQRMTDTERAGALSKCGKERNG